MSKYQKYIFKYDRIMRFNINYNQIIIFISRWKNYNNTKCNY